MVCPGIRFTTFGIAWSQEGSGSIAATVQTGPTSRRLGTPTVAQAEDAGPDLGTPDARHQTGRATDPVWVGDAQCARFSLTVPAGTGMGRYRNIQVRIKPEAIPEYWLLRQRELEEAREAQGQQPGASMTREQAEQALGGAYKEMDEA